MNELPVTYAGVAAAASFCLFWRRRNRRLRIAFEQPTERAADAGAGLEAGVGHTHALRTQAIIT